MKDSWIFLSFVGLFSLSAMTVIITHLVRKGIPTIYVLLALVFIVAVIDTLYVVLTRTKPGPLLLSSWFLLITAGILSALGNLAIYKATAISPNPGLVLTIFGLQAGIVAAASVIFFKDKLNSVQALGILLGIVAIAVIGLGSRHNNTTDSETKKVSTVSASRKNIKTS